DVARLDVREPIPVDRDPLLDASNQRPQPFDLESVEPLGRQSLELGLEDHPRILTRRGGDFPIFPPETGREQEGRRMKGWKARHRGRVAGIVLAVAAVALATGRATALADDEQHPPELTHTVLD